MTMQDSRIDPVAENILRHPAPIIYDEPEPQTNPKESILEQRKRKYSAGMYEYTKGRWEDVRLDIEKHSLSQSSTGTTGSESDLLDLHNNQGHFRGTVEGHKALSRG